MLKYDRYDITFAEVPKEISLYITITNCPIHCPNCNSKHLWDNNGMPLNWDNLNAIIHCQKGITCVTFGGGDSNPKEINKLAWHIRRSFPSLKICWYSGQDSISKDIDIQNFDYIKIGHFNGIPLNKKETNQIFWEIQHYDNGGFSLKNQTKLFQTECGE